MPALLFALLLALLAPSQSFAQPDRTPAPPSAATAQPGLSSSEARDARLQLDVKLKWLAGRERSFKLAGPLGMTIAGGVLLTSGVVGLSLARYEPDLVGGLMGAVVSIAAIPVGALVLIASSAVLMHRVGARSAVRREARELRAKRQQLDLLVAPTVGPTSYGLSLGSRF